MKVLITAVAALAVPLFAAGLATRGPAAGDRPDCPGKITCPQTGEQVCRDRCPTVDPQRPDCPGRIVCPETGRLICRDKCPLGPGDQTDRPGEKVSRPACCRK